MLQWCRENIAAGAWQQHGFDKARRDDNGIPPTKLAGTS
jgi:hypothetical protein